MQGKLITLEGVEGSGKSTQAELLQDYLQQQGYEVIITYEPGGTKIGKKIRKMLLDPENKNLAAKAELLLYEADRAQHVEEVIKPALEADKVVVSDRYFDATLAYQVYARGLDKELVTTLNNLAVGSIVPDLTLLLDIDPQLSLHRADKVTSETGDGDRIEAEKLSFHRNVRDGYLKLAEEQERIKVIDGHKSISDIFNRIKKVITERWL